MKPSLRIACRPSPLALVQVEEIVQSLGKPLGYEIVQIHTGGDKDRATPLTSARDDFFTDAIDQALLEGRADVAIHSAKDLPQNFNPQLRIYALTKCLDDKDAWVGPYSWKDLPANPKIGTSSLLRQKQILQMRPDAAMVNIRGNIAERLQLVKDKKLDGIVVAACALKRLKLEREIKDIFPWAGVPLQGQLAVVGRPDPELENLFASLDVRRNYGKVTLVGAGPGDPELITLKGIKALETADCVFYDYLVDTHLLTYAPQAEHIYAGKRKGTHSLSQEDLSRMLKEKALEGKNVVRLKGGDPLIFGRGADEIQYLRSYHIPVDVVPGISSATGIPSSLGIPLTARGVSSSVAFVSGHEEDEDKGHPKPVAIPDAQTIVFLMGLTKLGIIVESLKKAGWDDATPMMIIANGTKPNEQVIKGTMATIENLTQAEHLKPPALMVVGKTVEFYKPDSRQKHSGMTYEKCGNDSIERSDKNESGSGRKRSGIGGTFLHCGTHPEMYEYLGHIVHWPMIDIKPVPMNEVEREKFMQALADSDIVVFTSWYAVEYFFKRISAAIDRNGIQKIFAVIGRRTAEALQKHGLQPSMISLEETAEGLLKTMKEKLALKGKRILFPRSSLPNPYLKKALQTEGAVVTEIAIYQNTKPPRRDLPAQPLDGVIFTSPSCVRNFLSDYGTIPASWRILAKGPVTLKTLQQAGYSHATSLS